MSGLGEREGRPNSYASPMTACGHGLWRTGLLPVRRTAATGHGGTACLDEGADRLPHIMKIHPASLPYHTGVDHPSSVKVLRSGLKPQRARPQHTDTRPTRLPHGPRSTVVGGPGAASNVTPQKLGTYAAGACVNSRRSCAPRSDSQTTARPAHCCLMTAETPQQLGVTRPVRV